MIFWAACPAAATLHGKESCLITRKTQQHVQLLEQRSGRRSQIGLLAVFALGGALQLFGLTGGADRWLLDQQFTLLRQFGLKPVAHDVVVVGIDKETVDRIPEPIALWHAYLGAFLRAASDGDAAAVGLDVILPDRSYDFLKTDLDRSLLKPLLAVSRKLPVVLGRTIDADGRPRPIWPPFVSVVGHDSTGFALVRPDPDGVVRRFDPDLGTGRDAAATLVTRMAQKLHLRVSAGLIDYTAGRPFEYLPLREVLQWADQGNSQALRRAFAGRPVLLGTVLPLEDRLRVPVPLADWEPGQYAVPGVLVHAQTLRSLMGPGLIRETPHSLQLAGIAVAALLWFLATTLPGAGLALAGFGLAALGISSWLLHTGWWMPAGGALATALLATGGRLSREAALQMIERRRLRRAFGGYVSPQIMREILEGRLDTTLGGRRCNVCIMFSDIRGFTTRSEKMSPERVIRLLNRYFDEMTAAVHTHGGTVDKFIGDGMMAFFGAPKPLTNPCRPALDAARDMLARLATLNSRLEAEGIVPIRIGIGLCVGEAVIGHVGSESRHEYTAIGDVVNVASRLEGLTKELGYPVVCAAPVAQALPDESFAALGERPVKGHTPVQVFGWPGNSEPPSSPSPNLSS
jgi:adenylate cyclase